MSLFATVVGFFRSFGVMLVGEMLAEMKMRIVLVY